jgi:hypothetical protein
MLFIALVKSYVALNNEFVIQNWFEELKRLVPARQKSDETGTSVPEGNGRSAAAGRHFVTADRPQEKRPHHPFSGRRSREGQHGPRAGALKKEG